MNVKQKSWWQIQTAMREAMHDWIYDPNVMFIDYGWRERNGKMIKDEKCIRVHVIKKIAPGPSLEAATQSGNTRGQIPKNINGIPVDIPQGVYRVQQGWWGNWWSHPFKPRRNPRAQRQAPMQGGISISNARLRGYGTLGSLVTDREKNDKKMILSNWHVLAGRWYAQEGWPIYQPGRGDGGTNADTVAKLSRHAMESNLDAAVAELSGDRQLINNQYELEPVNGTGWAQLGMEVIKSGRKTDITYGLVTGIGGTAKMNYSGVKRLIRNVITIEPRIGIEVSAGGDSGSLWLEEETMNAIGLHFAGSNHPERALAIDIYPILDALNVELP